jgi:hypothetical protein
MPRRSDNLKFAINFTKRQLIRIKSEPERRRWFDRFCALSNLYKIELRDDPQQPGRTTDKLPTLDQRVDEILKKLNGGEDVDTTSSSPSPTSDIVSDGH